MNSIADVLARGLREAGLDVVFGLPGGENVELLEALRRQGLRFVLVHNESSALYMAAASARLTHRPGLCLTTLGPGLTNGMAGLGHAWLDRAPLLLLSAAPPELPDGVHTHQRLDQLALTRPLTKDARELRADDDVRATLHGALRECLGGRPGPVHLQVSRGVAASPATPVMEERPFSWPAPPPADLRDFTRVEKLCALARRPLILAGLGLEPQGCHAQLRALAEAAGAPVILTPKAKGALASAHPLTAGTIGLTRADPVYELLAETDLLLAIGFDVVELVRLWDSTAPLVWIAPWSNVDPELPSEAQFCGEMAPVLVRLAALPWRRATEWGASRVSRLHARLALRPRPRPSPGRMLPQDLLAALRALAPPATPLAVDVGSHKILASLSWPDLRPNRFLVSNGLSCMGYGLPAAIAASLGMETPTLCLTGDAGLMMCLGELGLLAHLAAPVVIVVMSDGALDLIRAAQVRADAAVYGTEFTNPDFVQVARAWGIESLRSADVEECVQAAGAALHAGRPFLLEALIDPAGYRPYIEGDTPPS